MVIPERIKFGANIEAHVPREKLRPGTKLYIAGPLGFAESTRPFHEKMIDLVVAMGGLVLDPWILTEPAIVQQAAQIPPGRRSIRAWQKVNRLIAENNMRAIQEATGVLANLDGVDIDSGTAAEIGYAFALGKPIIGYRGDFRTTGDNAGANVNLQVEYFIKESGKGEGSIVTEIAQLPQELLRVWGSDVVDPTQVK